MYEERCYVKATRLPKLNFWTVFSKLKLKLMSQVAVDLLLDQIDYMQSQVKKYSTDPEKAIEFIRLQIAGIQAQIPPAHHGHRHGARDGGRCARLAAVVQRLDVGGAAGEQHAVDSLKDLLQLQGAMKPHQIISLMDYFGADNTFAMADHDDHVHVGYYAEAGPGSGSVSKQFSAMLKPDQWKRLIARLGEIDNPTVPTKPSDAALPAPKGGKHGDRASSAHLSE